MTVVFYMLNTRIGTTQLVNGRIDFDLPLDVAGYLVTHGVAGDGRIVHVDEPALFMTLLPREFRSPYLRAVLDEGAAREVEVKLVNRAGGHGLAGSLQREG